MPQHPNPIDSHVGTRIRHRRMALNISQAELATQMGVSFQQVQKYETGKNRISASRLLDVARILRMPVQYFFNGLPGHDTDPLDDLTSAERDLVAAYRALPTPAQSQMHALFAAIAGGTLAKIA